VNHRDPRPRQRDPLADANPPDEETARSAYLQRVRGRDEVYRVGYEAIRNACVHSQGSKLRVTLTHADEPSVDVAENGVGLDPSGIGAKRATSAYKECASGLPGSPASSW
jgi:hypothetical protein